MGTAPIRDLRAVAWFERSLDAGVSTLHLDQTRLVAGDWDGGIHCWDLLGEALWSAQTSNRVGDLAVGGERMFAVCGRDLVCLDLAGGEIQWTVELEGSSDLVACTPDGDTVLATSSVFDIELNDFLESTLWRFDGEGNKVREDVITERPWSVEMRDDGVALLGLGRPRCGLVRAELDGLHHSLLPTESPVTCGLPGRTRTIIGHADGTLTCIEDGVVLEEGPFPKQPGSIEALACTPDGLIVGLNADTGAGLARAYSADGRKRWIVETEPGRKIEHVIDGPEIGDSNSVWIISWDGSTSVIEGCGELEGEGLIRFEEEVRVNAVIGDGENLVLGLADGSVFLLQGDLLNRRLTSDVEPEADGARSALAARLRALRD